MAKEKRSRIYPHVYQRSFEAMRGDSSPKCLMMSLALDPLAAADVLETGEWPPSRFADFCAHPDKNARQAALETLSTWFGRVKPSNLLSAVDMVWEYDSRIALWMVLDLPDYFLSFLSGKRLGMTRDAINLAKAVLAGVENPSTAKTRLEDLRSYFHFLAIGEDLSSRNDAGSMLSGDAMEALCEATLDLGNPANGYATFTRDVVRSIIRAIGFYRGFDNLSETERNFRNTSVRRKIIEEMADRILRYPYCH